MAAAHSFRHCHLSYACRSVFKLFLGARASTSSLRRGRALGTGLRRPVRKARSLGMECHCTSGHVSLPYNAKGPHQLCGLRASTPDNKKPAPVKLVSGPSRIDPKSWNLRSVYVDYTRFPFRQHKPCETTTTAHLRKASNNHREFIQKHVEMNCDRRHRYWRQRSSR
jgi:hypothetical protein